MKKPLLILYSLALLPLLYHAFASTAQSIPLTTNQKYNCSLYLNQYNDWQTYGGNYSNLAATNWRICPELAQEINNSKPGRVAAWILVGATDGEIYCGTCGGDSACGGNCISPN